VKRNALAAAIRYALFIAALEAERDRLIAATKRSNNERTKE
jgi:hypothetical protein